MTKIVWQLVLSVLAALATLAASCKKEPASTDESPPAAAASAAVPAAPVAASAAAPESDVQAEKIALETNIAFVKAVKANKERFQPTNAVQYNEETDPNKLLGRPGQYIVKMNWKVAGGDATLEIFRSADDAKKRAEYTQTIAKSAPMFLQYVYLNEKRRAVLRLPKELTPTKAKEWQAMFEGL